MWMIPLRKLTQQSLYDRHGKGMSSDGRTAYPVYAGLGIRFRISQSAFTQSQHGVGIPLLSR